MVGIPTHTHDKMLPPYHSAQGLTWVSEDLDRPLRSLRGGVVRETSSRQTGL